MSKWTPGPWTFEKVETTMGCGHQVVAANGQVICDDEPYYPAAVCEADARLIAKAPEMYELLNDFLLRDDIADDELGDAARALIEEINA